MKTITTKSGFSFTPPEHILDDWDFLSILGRMASPNLTDADAMAGYFQLVNALMTPEDLERLKDHVRQAQGYASFWAIQTEVEELIAKLKDDEGNSSSSPESSRPVRRN